MKILTYLLILHSLISSPAIAETINYFDPLKKSLVTKVDSITVGGTVWIEQDDDGIFDTPIEAGAFGVEVAILTYPALTFVASTTTNSIGNYSFKVIPGDYIISILSTNFGSGYPLNTVISCTPTADPNNDVDSDDNGIGPAVGPVESGVVSLIAGSEPTDFGLSNFTIDFGFIFGCGNVSTFFSESCELVVDTFCNLSILNTGCSTMFSGPLVEPAPNPLCNGGGAPHNMSWFAFVAGSGDYNIEIIPLGCTPGAGGQLGIQTGIYTDCTFSESLFCMNSCTTGSISVPSTNLTPGNTYYWWFDGCAGSVCSYDINVSGTFVEYVIPEPTEIVCASGTCYPICPNNRVTLQVNEGYDNVTLKFVWRITDPMGNITTVNTLSNQLPDYLLDKVGVWKFEILSISNRCNSSSVIKELLLTVRQPVDEDFGTVSLCENFIPGWIGPSEDSMGNADPNGDGFAGWQIHPFVFTSGSPPGALNIASYPGTGSGQEGCIYKQTVRLINLPSSTPLDLNFVLCLEDLPYMVSPDFPFSITGDLPSTMVVLEGQAGNGCDSLVNLEVIVLEASGQVQQVATTDSMVRLDSFIIESSPVIHTIKWKKSDGTIIDDGNADSDSLTTRLPGSGEYLCEIIMTFNGKTCINQIPFEVTITSSIIQEILPDISFNNPVTKGILYLRSASQQELNVKIMNLNGSILNQMVNIKTNSELPIGNIPSGIYFIEINQGSQKIIEKLVVLD